MLNNNINLSDPLPEMIFNELVPQIPSPTNSNNYNNNINDLTEEDIETLNEIALNNNNFIQEEPVITNNNDQSFSSLTNPITTTATRNLQNSLQNNNNNNIVKRNTPIGNSLSTRFLNVNPINQDLQSLQNLQNPNNFHNRSTTLARLEHSILSNLNRNYQNFDITKFTNSLIIDLNNILINNNNFNNIVINLLNATPLELINNNEFKLNFIKDFKVYLKFTKTLHLINSLIFSKLYKEFVVNNNLLLNDDLNEIKLELERIEKANKYYLIYNIITLMPQFIIVFHDFGLSYLENVSVDNVINFINNLKVKVDKDYSLNINLNSLPCNLDIKINSNNEIVKVTMFNYFDLKVTDSNNDNSYFCNEFNVVNDLKRLTGDNNNNRNQKKRKEN
ncbi:hypothetical protein ABK040_002872 [Willaertia magna]